MIFGKYRCETLLRCITALPLICTFAIAYTYLSTTALACGWAVIFLAALLLEWPLFKAGWLTPIYPLLPMLSVIALHIIASRWISLLALVIAAAGDTGGYFIGKKWGYHKISPNISPGKSWEGFFGGIGITLIATYLITLAYQATPSLPALVLLVGGGATAGLIGDLVESYLKRRAGLKDSGWLLPGHGGLLDRFDSLLGIAPFMLLLVLYKIL